MRNDSADGAPDASSSTLEQPVTVVEQLLNAFARHGEAPAVCDRTADGAEITTYAELDALSAHVARRLAERGVRPGDRVGLAVERSTAMIASLVGILRAGAAYVPLDPTYPAERIAVMCADADLRLVVATAPGSVADHIPVALWAEIADGPEVTGTPAPEPTVQPDDVAFVIFTSGSTGRPKGVEMPHRALANLVDWQLRRSTFVHGARVLQYTSVSFDVSFQEIATTLASGGQLFMVDDAVRRDPRSLLSALADWEIERLYLPFVALRSLIEVSSQGGGLPTSLTEVITAGEQLRVDDTLRAAFAANPAATLDNQYGPSETHVITAHLLDGDPAAWPDLPPIGQAIDHCDVQLLDDELEPVEPGEIGQLYLGGRNLAHGYFRRPDLTAERFVLAGPGASDPVRWYRSGDLGRRDEAGDIHYVGRVDHQVKIRGHRVEPGEINSVGSRFPGVTQCLTHAFEKTSGAPFLVTYYTVGSGASVDPTVLREHLRAHLPDYMVPAFATELDTIAYGPSGKVDVLSLPDPRSGSLGTAPSYETDTERRLAEIWADVLEFPNLPADANFFDLGGDSLAAVTLFLRISEAFGHDMPLATVTSAPTIRALARRIDERAAGAAAEHRSLQLLHDGPDDVPPLFLVHGGGGNILIFAELAQRLAPGQRVYGFQWSGWDGGRGERSVPEMVQAYRRELLTVQPEGPYRIGGHCIGGLIAIELARSLVADGAEIDGPLVVSDAPNLGASSYHPGDPAADSETAARFDTMADELLDLVPDELRVDGWRGLTRTQTDAPAGAARNHGLVRNVLKRMPWVLGTVRRGRRWLDDARIAAMVRLHRPVPINLREQYCTETLKRAARRHDPTPWPGDVLYFRTATFQGSEMALDGWWSDPHLGFGELAGGTFDAHVVGGRHNDPLKLDYSAKRVRAAFDTTG